ncbi:hypothetical protein BO94DRAFT_566542 [Aspergillus sclerotioniger CBS 115572]|uniref:F-box domain-containing protein n=1 Tax=Aspergillus sclerotioniger CBS 115572 TaxID=1450535 RepID=A0A317WLC4_9EURO|nr:hypothetical protein BO94DRAFT_566542 [Aspergillus sclerotioniger CBS 115572]PWY85818.1 hypothetical protein BO94DRAFT_566542 [Aspergillus sclerotioniger CBS 115572]
MDLGEATTRSSEADDVLISNIIRTASYHRCDFDLAVIRTNPEDHRPVRTSLVEDIHITYSCLGKLEILPLEIVHQICLLLDIWSLFRFRQVNRRARQAVSAINSYKVVVSHALEALCITLRTNIATWFLLSDLFDVLCTMNCHFCGAFGGFIFLLSFRRCCFSCIRADALPCVLALSDVKHRIKRRSGRVCSMMPTVRTLPGIYSMAETVRKRRTEIRALPERRVLLPYMVTTSLPYFDHKRGVVQRGISCSGCQVALEKALRSSRVESGACAMRDKVYSHNEFLHHLKACQEAQNLWKSRRRGYDNANFSEFIRRGGYFKRRDVIMSFNSKEYA